MAAVKGRTGNPGVSNPLKKNSTSFAVSGEEPKGRTIAFRPPQSLEKKIDEFLEKSGLRQAEFLEQAAIAYLEERRQLPPISKQRQLSSDNFKSGAEEPATTTGDEAPASGSRNTGREEDQASDTKTSSKSKTRPGTRTKTRKTPSS